MIQNYSTAKGRLSSFGSNLFIGLLFFFLSTGITVALPASTDFDLVKERVVKEYLTSEVDKEEIQQLLTSQNPDGTWPGINYQDVSRTGFEHYFHTGNMVTLAKAYQHPNSTFRGSPKVKQAISNALDHWVQNDYFCDNWWYNQIGIPNNLVAVMLLLGDELPEELVQATQPIIGRAHLNASGARPSGDRIKIAGILAKNLLFLGEKEKFETVLKVIEGEIKFSTGSRGLQRDFSFHHRVDRVNNTSSYGLGYADAFVEWLVYTAATQYSFSRDKVEILVDYYLDGISKNLAFGKYLEAGAKNRGIARPGALHGLDAKTPKKLLQATDYRKGDLEEIVKIREEGIHKVSLSYGKYFWQTEFFTYQRPGFFTSVRMYSIRNDNMEVSYNSEGLMNHHRGDGTNHLSITGKEYFDIFPVMDFQKIPGATILQKEKLPDPDQIQKSGYTDFVGAVTDDLYGSVAFDFISPHDPLKARKSWFFFDKEYVCLGAGINAKGKQEVFTTLNQLLLKGEVYAQVGHQMKILESGKHGLKNPDWIYHDRVGYFMLAPQDVELSFGEVTGNWTSINRQTRAPQEDVTKEVFSLWVNHGNNVRQESYAYMILPNASLEETKAYRIDDQIEILANTPELQAVRHKQLLQVQANFYQAGKLDLGDGLELTMDGPGLVLLHLDGQNIVKMAVSDPSRKLNRMHFQLNSKLNLQGTQHRVAWDAEHWISKVTVQLPEGEFAGSSVILGD
ncbi:polysaccharide lyase family 8 super-sandwich domain-containing protein [Cyclobacterium marinum]|uniref:polysaccharide lyase family 8 super-sandwich domain-containing protein n=1 Tax=Cyclobacterium marinum TaxID=104 RepID=UPI0030DA3C7B